jgi:hypothetical protein
MIKKRTNEKKGRSRIAAIDTEEKPPICEICVICGSFLNGVHGTPYGLRAETYGF